MNIINCTFRSPPPWLWIPACAGMTVFLPIWSVVHLFLPTYLIFAYFSFLGIASASIPAVIPAVIFAVIFAVIILADFLASGDYIPEKL